MKEIIFNVVEEEKGSFSAFWNNPRGGGISTQGHNLPYLEAMINEAVQCHFDEEEIPFRIKLHFSLLLSKINASHVAYETLQKNRHSSGRWNDVNL